MAASRNKPSVDLLAALSAFLAARCESGPLALALSGGCDSVVLLHLLSRLGLQQPLRAIHVHHGLSPNADQWANFCLEYARRLGVTCDVVPVAVDRDHPLGLEAAARQARYAAFENTGWPLICLAHHAGDQAETVLFNLLRGSGVSGLAGIPAQRQTPATCYLRPLLDVSRAEIESYARQEKLDWITDESNADTRFSRNFIRHEVLTAISRRFPAAESQLSASARHFAEADGLLAELAEIDWQRLAVADALPMRAVRSLSFSRLKNLLRYRLRGQGWRAPDARRLDEFARQLLTAAPDRHPRLDLPDGSMFVRGGALHWQARH